ncbi:putative glycolipid-binding domain-containing protein [Amycolatopsis sp. A133]|uniref:putative glycolipid-binding domain-containing protein n=1 Tax=Amycolatopsis sp. A133 TaxID=3064472 RepID=UPI0027E962C0|nr:putative glycolipid-binding domain-containing protein [Amycolatopsis sp. A133]MDQ7802446.1 putative glycolipid-binding domain-containing protein [Amycolatopsis sp. A133]
MSFPGHAAWRHEDTRTGFEVTWFRRHGGGWVAEGATTAVEDGVAWAVRYSLTISPEWTLTSARIGGAGARELEVEADGRGHWRLDGRPAPHLDGCLDLDLESSVMTNTFPVHRLALPPGGRAEAPAAYVRAADFGVERLEQTYEHLTPNRYRYAAPSFGFSCVLDYDGCGLITRYPGIAVRHPATVCP